MPISTLYPAGISPAGWAPVSDLSEKAVRDPLGPVEYKPRTRDFAGTDGKWASLHWVDQQVELALLIRKGYLRSAPEVGHTFFEIRRLTPTTIQADVEDRVRLALVRLLSRTPPAVQVVRVLTDVATKPQLRIAVDYINMITGSRRTSTWRNYNNAD
jgi:hypothetical protein